MIYVVRHAPVAVSGVCYGQIDVATSIDADAAGASIAEQLATLSVRFTRVVASPALRARLPAFRVARAIDAPLAIDPRLAELAFGAWEGRAYADLEANDPRFQAWMFRWRQACPPGGERVDDLVARVVDLAREIDAGGEPTLLVCHAGPIRALRAWARGVDYADVVGEPVEHLAVERLPARRHSGVA